MMTAAQEDGGSWAGKLKFTAFSLLNVTAGQRGFWTTAAYQKNKQETGAVMKKS